MHSQALIHTAIQAALEAGKAIMEVYRSSQAEVTFKEDRSPLTLADRRAHLSIMRDLTVTKIPILSEEGRQIPFPERKSWQSLWIIDPLDGTKEFINRNGEFTVNIALVEKGMPMMGVIYAPVLNEIWYGAVGYGAWHSFTKEVFSAEKIVASASPIPQPSEARPYRIAGSRSHFNEETETFIKNHLTHIPEHEFISRGSSLKLCMIADGSADIYPRFGPTMEWDTAAGDAIIKAAGASIVDAALQQPLKYNKADLLNPHFIASAKVQ